MLSKGGFRLSIWQNFKLGFGSHFPILAMYYNKQAALKGYFRTLKSKETHAFFVRQIDAAVAPRGHRKLAKRTVRECSARGDSDFLFGRILSWGLGATFPFLPCTNYLEYSKHLNHDLNHM